MATLPNDLALLFWGKTGFRADACPAAKPVLSHLVDVAAVAWQLLQTRPALAARLAERLKTDVEPLACLVAFLAGLHDLGKISIPFQAKSDTFWPETLLGPLPAPAPFDAGHWRYTALLMRHEPIADMIDTVLPGLGGASPSLLALVAGHHGRPPESKWLGAEPFGPQDENAALPPPCLQAAQEAVDFLRTATGIGAVPAVTERRLMDCSFLLNGLITSADWVGSDSAFFGFDGPPFDQGHPHTAFAHSSRIARDALQAKGLVPLAPSRTFGWQALGLPASAEPRPMQQVMAQVALPDGPCLFIIEDMTGSGKTEAALFLASRLMQAGKGEGVYIALPTMATANAMHARLAPVAQSLFQGGDPSLILAHGRADLARRLAALGNRASRERDETNATTCNAWIADSRRKALFADVGAGTVDQAFLAILQKKHLTLRQFALAGRILIIDEAHSFDAYMGEELKTLIALHAMNGGSTIVLSATLTTRLRAGLISAFHSAVAEPPDEAALADVPPFMQAKARARLATHAPQPASRHYPLLTSMAGRGLIETPVALNASTRPPVGIERFNDRAAALALALDVAAQGAAVAIICNAVDEAIAVYHTIAEALGAERAMLFHARFAMGDRMAIEEKALRTFGKKAAADERAGKVLVATQVVEQSLDLDLDLIISDLAPADMLIQRAGRLWRHMDERPEEARALAQPTLAIVAPDHQGVTSDTWLNETLGAAAFVYRNPAVLWRSAREMFARTHLPSPDDPAFRAILEAVYDDGLDDVPTCLLSKVLAADGQETGDRTIARHNIIDPKAGYAMVGANLSADETIGTRLGEAMTSLRLAHRDDGRLVPWVRVDGGDDSLNWELSEISVRTGWLKRHGYEAEAGSSAEADAIKATWSEFDQAIALVEVGNEGTFVPSLPDTALTYNHKIGLTGTALQTRE